MSSPPVSSPPPPGPTSTKEEWRAWRHSRRGFYPSPWRATGPWRFFFPSALVAVGLYYLLANLGLLPFIHGDIFWPSILIFLGLLLLFRRLKSS